MAWRGGPHRGRRAGHEHSGVTPGTCEALSSPRVNQNTGDWLTNPWPAVTDARSLTGANQRAQSGTAKRRQRSAAGWTTGSRSASYYRRSWGTDPRDPVEGRGRRVAERLRGTMVDIPRPETISTKQQTIASRRGKRRNGGFHVAQPLHRPGLAARGLSAHAQGRRSGVDRQTAKAYAEHLEENLQDLLNEPNLAATGRRL